MASTSGTCGTRRAISARATAAGWSGTARRTSSQPVATICSICATVAPTSRVSVLVIDCTMTGASPPITSGPTFTARVLRRGRCFSSIAAPPCSDYARLIGKDARDVIVHHHHEHQQQEDHADLQQPLLDAQADVALQSPFERPKGHVAA